MHWAVSRRCAASSPTRPPTLPTRPHTPTLLQVIKMLMTEEVRGRPRSVYGMRLKNNIANRKRAEALGVTLHRTAGVIEKADASAEKEVPAVEGRDKLR